MIATAIEAVGYGLFLAALVGPIFVSLVDTSIQYGKKAGLVLASGIWVSDFVIVALLLAFTDLRTMDVPKIWAQLLALAAGIIFCTIGLIRIVKWQKMQTEDASINPRKKSLVLKGLMVNTLNPFTLIFWTTLIAGQTLIKQKDEYSLLLFFGVLLLTIIATDMAKVFLSHKLGSMLHSRQIQYLNLITGFVFIISGSYIVYRFLFS